MPSQNAPPFRGAGLVQVRERFWTPLPQFTLHGDHSVHKDQPPLTAVRERDLLNKTTLWEDKTTLLWPCQTNYKAKYVSTYIWAGWTFCSLTLSPSCRIDSNANVYFNNRSDGAPLLFLLQYICQDKINRPDTSKLSALFSSILCPAHLLPPPVWLLTTHDFH